MSLGTQGDALHRLGAHQRTVEPDECSPGRDCVRALLPSHPLSRCFGLMGLLNVFLSLTARFVLVDLVSRTGLNASEWAVFLMALKVSVILYMVSMDSEWSAPDTLRCQHLLILGFATVLLNSAWIGVGGSHAASNRTTLPDFSGFAAFGLLLQGTLVAFLAA
mmetsp:Transcript_15115/g.45288  ORF Transcript_15115/g.45288 Transcript_15115/m.45288 type:complete len:163 (+) Transcript_15115:51-539(+)|eukprot:CAMPEP_0177658562 /NCGR_PEP_ID=MMETSP0447-20121125/16883_1 /TAXON_ID=0 /ORGANISM="Stygamoeba regulata, Strain BSH-02190019" /LENGTH=162 /DNA_ID=CAMNT_0019163189 /DNA_START=51 /DNA_END=539 /DNA_ORIENTATION=+